MSRLAMILSSFFVLVSANTAQSQYLNIPARPDFAKWTLISRSDISITVSDSVKYHLGLDLKYQNPANLNEYGRQIKAFVPFIVVKSNRQQDRNFSDTAITYVTDGAEKKNLDTYLEKSDPILEVRWSEKKDLDRGTSEQDGDNEVWFWDSSGNWTYGRGVIINRQETSEKFQELKNEIFIIGFKYSLDKKIYHAHEIPRVYIVLAMRAEKGGK